MRFLICSALTIISATTLAIASDESSAIQLQLNGRSSSLSWSAEDPGAKTLYAVIKGNSSSMLSLSIDAPVGTKISASLATLSGSVAEALKQPKRFVPLQVMTRQQSIKLSRGPCFSFSPGEGSPENTDVPPIDPPVSDSPLCALFSPNEKAAIAEAIAALYGTEWSEGQICGFLVSNYLGGAEPCDPADPICSLLQALDEGNELAQLAAPTVRTYSSYVVRLSRNACAPARTKYVLKLVAQISGDSMPATATIQASESIFSGDRAASIKPVSDGRFAPQPILLMSYLGSLCGQRVEIAKWSGGIRRSKTAVTVADLVPYSGRVLTRTPIGRFMTGGKATFELFNGRSNYAVCFALTRKRQKVNGY